MIPCSTKSLWPPGSPQEESCPCRSHCCCQWVGTSGTGGAALLPQPLPGLSSNWGREELLGTASGPQHSDLLFEQPSVWMLHCSLWNIPYCYTFLIISHNTSSCLKNPKQTGLHLVVSMNRLNFSFGQTRDCIFEISLFQNNYCSSQDFLVSAVIYKQLLKTRLSLGLAIPPLHQRKVTAPFQKDPIAF